MVVVGRLGCSFEMSVNGMWLFSRFGIRKCIDGLILGITSLVSVQTEVLATLLVYSPALSPASPINVPYEYSYIPPS